MLHSLLVESLRISVAIHFSDIALKSESWKSTIRICYDSVHQENRIQYSVFFCLTATFVIFYLLDAWIWCVASICCLTFQVFTETETAHDFFIFTMDDLFVQCLESLRSVNRQEKIHSKKLLKFDLNANIIRNRFKRIKNKKKMGSHMVKIHAIKTM